MGNHKNSNGANPAKEAQFGEAMKRILRVKKEEIKEDKLSCGEQRKRATKPA